MADVATPLPGMYARPSCPGHSRQRRRDQAARQRLHRDTIGVGRPGLHRRRGPVRSQLQQLDVMAGELAGRQRADMHDARHSPPAMLWPAVKARTVTGPRRWQAADADVNRVDNGGCGRACVQSHLRRSGWRAAAARRPPAPARRKPPRRRGAAASAYLNPAGSASRSLSSTSRYRAWPTYSSSARDGLPAVESPDDPQAGIEDRGRYKIISPNGGGRAPSSMGPFSWVLALDALMRG